MAYLARDERRATIIATAADIIIEGGLLAATTRAVATRMGIATGQIHHHFGSTSELRAEAFVSVTAAFLKRDLEKAAALPPLEQVMAALGGGDDDGEAEQRLWLEALATAERDEAIRAAVARVLAEWHKNVVAVIDLGVQQRSFRAGIDPTGAGWRLIAAVVGLEGLGVLDLIPSTEVSFRRHLEALLHQELME